MRNTMREALFSPGRLIVHVLLLSFAAVLAIVIYGLVTPNTPPVAVFFVLSFALLTFAVGQAVYELGTRRFFIFFVISTIVGFLFELLGTSTGVPFGKYQYGDLLGQGVFGVPLVVPLVWFVIAYLSFSLAFKSFHAKTAKLLTGDHSVMGLVALTASGAVAWDLMIDPMFSSYGYWTWKTSGLSLPSISGIPISNFIGWFVVLFAMMIVFMVASPPSLGKVFQRQNTWDTRIVYILLIIDGIFANNSLRNYEAITFGAIAMIVFLVITLVLGKEKLEKTATFEGLASRP